MFTWTLGQTYTFSTCGKTTSLQYYVNIPFCSLSTFHMDLIKITHISCHWGEPCICILKFMLLVLTSNLSVHDGSWV